jgi:hypothetical protein
MNVKPTRKVAYGAIAGALSLIVVWLVNTYATKQIPTEIGMAITTVITAVLQYVIPDAEEASPTEPAA